MSAQKAEADSQQENKNRAPMALMAAFIAGIRLARVESDEISRQSRRVRAALSDSITIAKALLHSKEFKQ